MPHARKFTFGPYHIDTTFSTILLRYSADLENGSRIEYTDTVTFPGVTKKMWERIPENILSTLSQSLVLIHGIYYWRIHPTPSMHVEGFSLTQEQSEFWNELYTKDLGEFFYKSQIDFRGLVSFPYEKKYAVAAMNFPCSPRTLLAVGGGKDSIVSAEMLKESGIPFDLFVSNPVGIQERVAGLIGRPVINVRRRKDPKLKKHERLLGSKSIYANLSKTVFQSVFAAILHDYRYIIFSNEQSADIGNVNYLGLNVNHQWCKSTEAERLIGGYIARFITPDVTHFSLIRGFSELEMTRRFTKYPKYFRAFSSCNMNFILPKMILEGKHGRGFWCKKCPKCVFIFACLSAFLPKKTVTDIVGANLYTDPQLLTVFRQLLGLEGFKPFECVGVPEEMIVAMHKAEETHSYDTDIAMRLFSAEISSRRNSFKEIEHDVFSRKPTPPVPQVFESCISASEERWHSSPVSLSFRERTVSLLLSKISHFFDRQ